MEAIRTEHTTRTLNAPAEMDNCDPLPVVVAEDPDGSTVLISTWRASWRERLGILFNGLVRLHVGSNVHPPVFLTTKDLVEGGTGLPNPKVCGACGGNTGYISVNGGEPQRCPVCNPTGEKSCPTLAHRG